MNADTEVRYFHFSAGVHEYGSYAAESVDQAKELFAKDAGYRGWAHMVEECGENDLRIAELTHRQMLEKAMEASGSAGDVVAAAALQIALYGHITEATADIITEAQRAEALQASRAK